MRITLYSPNDVVPLARQIVSGELARPGRVDKACFPPLLAYEHKYGYKLKFLTDNNIAVLDTVTVTNVVVCVAGTLSVLRVALTAKCCLPFRFFHGVFVGSDLCGFPKGLERIANPFLLRIKPPKYDLKPSFGQRLDSRLL